MFTRYQAITGAAILALTTPLMIAADEVWTMDHAAAKTTAAEAGKDLLLEFTGSDWCPPCKMLNSEVFSQEAFLTTAPEHFVLVKLDFPQDKSGLTEEIQEQNTALAEKYGIEGFPTIILSDAEGRPYARTGFQPGGVDSYLEHLDTLRENRIKRDEAFAAAKEAEGVEKAKILVAALDALDLDPEALEQFYGEVIESIKANDPDDESGFAKRSEIQQRINEFQMKITEMAGAGDFEGILTVIDETLKIDGLSADEKQEITLTRALVFIELERYDEALNVVDEAAAIAPESDIIQHLDGFKAQIIAERDAAQAEESEEE